VSLAILLGVLFVLGGRSLFEPTFTFETYFDGSVSGLGIGAQVQFRGVPLGQVSEITTTASEYEDGSPIKMRKSYILVRAKLSGDVERVQQWRKEIAAYIERGLRAQTQFAGITGQQFLALDFLPPDKNPPLPIDWTPAYPYIPSAPSLTGQIIDSAQQFLGSLNKADVGELGRNLNSLVQTLNQKAERLPIEKLSDEASAVLADARTTIDHLDQVIEKAPVVRALDNIADASGRLDTLLEDPGLKQTVDNAAAFTGGLRALIEKGDVDAVIADLDRTIQRVDALIGDNQYDVRVVIQDLRATADNLRSLSETAKRYPAGVLIGGPPEEVDMPWKERRR
ncbi:MAG: MlaD family protein, partial [Thiohalocapsa sp.]|jgi:phospholipid/cholesterol/gamma-HCH transport system substrate-binding protein/paraquat-inducible protein B